MRDHWDLVARSYFAYTDACVRQCYLALEQQGKEREAPLLLEKALREAPQLLDEAQQGPPGWIYNRLVFALVGQQRAGEALSWAKARFALCRYEPAAMERSGRALIGAWAALDPARREATAFLAHLRKTRDPRPETQDLGGRGPLAGVPMPAVERKAATEVLTRLQGGGQLTHDRVGLHLLAGNVREAVLEARRLVTDSPEQPAGALELCRVLKALELGPASAAALLAYLKDGKGADPLPAALAPYGFGAEPFTAEKLAVQRTALAQTPIVLGDALAEAIGRAAPLPEVAAGTGLPVAAALPGVVEVPALPAAPAPVAAGPAPVAPPALPMPGVAAVQVAVPTWGAPTTAGMEGVRPAVAPVPAGTGIKVPGVVAAPATGAPAPGDVKVAVVEGVGPAPAAAQPAAAAAPAGVALPAPVSANTALAVVALARLAAGEITAEAAWEEGKLTGSDVLRALDALPVWGEDAHAAALCALLATHCPERIEDPRALPAPVRVLMARYYTTVGDSRSVVLYESLLTDPNLVGYIEAAASGLGSWYKKRHDYRRAADAFLRGTRSPNGAVCANALVEAARALVAAGDSARAETLYQQVPQFGYAWATGVAALDRAQALIGKGKHEAARRILAKRPRGRYADQVAVPMLGLLGYSYYRTGEFANALKHCKAAVAQYDRLESPLTGERLEQAVSEAARRVNLLECWQRGPLVCEPPHVEIGDGVVRPCRASILVRSYKPWRLVTR